MKQDCKIRSAASGITIGILCALFHPCATRGQDLLYFQNFDAKVMTSGWSTQNPAGNGNSFRSGTTSNPIGIPPYSGSKLLLVHVSNGGQLRSFPGTWFDTTGYSSLALRFMMYHDTASTAGEQVQVQASNTMAVSWSNFGIAIPRYTGSNGWQQHEVDLSGYVGQSRIYAGFLVSGAGGSDVHIDNIELLGTVTTPVVLPDHIAAGSQITVTGNHFGAETGKVSILPGAPNAKAVKLKVTSWTDTAITCLVPKESMLLPHDVQIFRKGPKGAPVITAPNTCTFCAPEIDKITPSSCTAGDILAIDGGYFGTKTPIVTLSSGGADGAFKCKVLDSAMDPSSGDSTLHFIVPEKIPNGTYDVQVGNKAGTGIDPGGLSVGK